MLDPSAAGNLHADDGQAFDVVAPDDLCQFFCIVHRIQLRTSDQSDMVPDKTLVKIGISVGGAVGCDQKMGALEIRRVYRGQLDLHRPLESWLCGAADSRGVLAALQSEGVWLMDLGAWPGQPEKAGCA